jgi:hypothetical protein
MADTDESVRVSGLFYKYREFPADCDKEGWERLELMLRDRQIYFSSPKQLNDPFDCFPHVTLDCSTAEARRKSEEYIAEGVEQRDGVKVTEKHRRDPGFQRAVSELMADITSERARTDKLYDQIAAHTGVYCMSKQGDSILQWSYYAKGHSGFCLEFNIPPKAAPPFDMVVGMEYVQDRRSVDVFDLISKNNKAYLWPLVRRKLDRWQHEEEVRAFVTRSGLTRFSPGMLTGVIFGTKTAEPHKEWLQRTLEQGGMRVRYYQLERSYSHFQLDRRELP